MLCLYRSSEYLPSYPVQSLYGCSRAYLCRFMCSRCSFCLLIPVAVKDNLATAMHACRHTCITAAYPDHVPTCLTAVNLRRKTCRSLPGLSDVE